MLQTDLAVHEDPHQLVLVAEHMFSFIGANPYTILIHEALQQTDKQEFIATIKLELQEYIDRKHCKTMPLKNVLKHKTDIPIVW